jgi:hypothetical protein
MNFGEGNRTKPLLRGFIRLQTTPSGVVLLFIGMTIAELSPEYVRRLYST